MIEIGIERNGKGYITAYKVLGHAQAPVKGGYDLVCNSVSVLSQAALIGLERQLCRSVNYKVDLEEGLLAVALKEEADELSEAILATMVYALKEVAEQYPQYVRIKDRGHRR